MRGGQNKIRTMPTFPPEEWKFDNGSGGGTEGPEQRGGKGGETSKVEAVKLTVTTGHWGAFANGNDPQNRRSQLTGSSSSP